MPPSDVVVAVAGSRGGLQVLQCTTVHGSPGLGRAPTAVICRSVDLAKILIVAIYNSAGSKQLPLSAVSVIYSWGFNELVAICKRCGGAAGKRPEPR